MNDYERIARVIQYLDRHHSDQPDLEALAKEVHLSRFHFHRLFVRWAGVTPKAFLQCLTVNHARDLLARGGDVLGVALEAGLSGPGRLHDLTVNLEAASPGEIKSGGADWTIQTGFAPTPFGLCRISEGPRGICDLTFVDSNDRTAGETAIRALWPSATIHWNDPLAKRTAKDVFRFEEKSAGQTPLRAFVQGTRFQVRVWRALLNLPAGAAISYEQLARMIGQAGAARAVGTAVSRNPLAFLIPCHRVLRKTGVVGEYRWGSTRKKAILAWESSPRTALERPEERKEA